MCGIAGCLGPGIIQKDLEALKELSYCMGLRGMDSTGIYQANIRNGKVISSLLEKDNSGVTYFKWFHESHRDGNKKIFEGITNTVFAVHTRAATKGAITVDNAHPFEFDNLVGMHNGTLVDKKYSSRDKTDSELLFQDANERGLSTVLSELDDKSAYSIVMIDKQKGEIIFTTNGLRPFHFCVVEDRSVVFWASEPGALRWIMNRHNIKIKENTVYTLKRDNIYSINPGAYINKGPIYTIEELPKPVKVFKPAQQKKVIPKGGERMEDEGGKIVNFPKNKNTNEKIPTVFCHNCHKKLSLYEQWKSGGVAVKSCVDCDDLPWSTVNSSAIH